MKSLRGYTDRKNGTRMRTRQITVHIPETLTQAVMDRRGITQRAAERDILHETLCAAMECCGLLVGKDGEFANEVPDYDDAQFDDFGAPVTVVPK